MVTLMITMSVYSEYSPHLNESPSAEFHNAILMACMYRSEVVNSDMLNTILSNKIRVFRHLKAMVGIKNRFSKNLWIGFCNDGVKPAKKLNFYLTSYFATIRGPARSPQLWTKRIWLTEQLTV